MRHGRRLAAAVALLGAAVATGCGLGPGDSTAGVVQRVTRDFGNDPLRGPSGVEAAESGTVLRLLDSEADVTTRYGGKFVQSIDGIEGASEGGRRFDWFFYVDGVESPTGSADVTPGPGQEIWWDYRDWSTAMRVPAVVGSFPEPFAHGFEGKEYGTRIDCLGERLPCEQVQAVLAKHDVEAGIFEAQHAPGSDAEGDPTLRILVGPWAGVGADPAAAQIDEGPEVSGVFARFAGQGPEARLAALTPTGAVAGDLGPGGGLVAAVRFEDHPPTWIVSGAQPRGVRAAAEAFNDVDLNGRYAIVSGLDLGGGAEIAGGEVTPIPVIAAP